MLVIIGCGNPVRSDDGVGCAIAQRLERVHGADSPMSPIRVFDAGTNGMAVMFQARGASRLIIVDACRTGSDPGAVFEIPGEEIGDRQSAGINSHDFRWSDAIHAGRKIFGAAFPTDVMVFLIEAEKLDFGLELSETVEKAASFVMARITTRIESYLAEPTAEHS